MLYKEGGVNKCPLGLRGNCLAGWWSLAGYSTSFRIVMLLGCTVTRQPIDSDTMVGIASCLKYVYIWSLYS
jgi:hypothetical protein